MSDPIFSHVRKVFDGGVVAVRDFSLTVPSPGMVVLVGPSGCGKTTLLRMIAGLETPTGGTIHLGETRLDTMEPRDRDIAMVFQSFALYPHMTVAVNLSFGLRVRKVPRATIEQKVQEAARTLELDKLVERKPAFPSNPPQRQSSEAAQNTQGFPAEPSASGYARQPGWRLRPGARKKTENPPAI